MGLEAATNIDELNPAWPLGSDPVAEADNHLRLIKSVLQSDMRSIFAFRRLKSFQIGALVTAGDILLDEGTNHYFYWQGVYPPAGYVVQAGSTPATAGGISDDGWLDVGAGKTSQNVLYETVKRVFAGEGLTVVAGSFEQGGKILFATDLLLQESTGRAFYWKGTIPSGGKDVPAKSSPSNSGGLGDTGWQVAGYPADIPINPILAPYSYKDSDTLEKRTASLQAAFNAANTLRRSIELNHTFRVRRILLENHTDYKITGNGSIQGELPALAAEPYLLGIKNCTGLSGGDGVFLTGPTTGYGIACKAWGEGESSPGVLRTCSLHVLGFRASNIPCVWQFGDDAHPDNLMSEVVIKHGYSYNVKEVARVIGSQAVIEFQGYQAIVAQDAGVPFTVKGGVLHFNGGELQMPSITNGYMVQLLPINSPGFENRYGSCYLNGTAVECASLWLFAHNPSAVPDVVAGSGKFVMNDCSGFANFAGDNLQSDASFKGSVVITDTCEFHRTSPKPANSYIAGIFGAAKVKVADAAFDANFKTGLQAFRPGAQIPQYGFRKILEVNNLSGQSFPQSVATTMKFASVAFTGENAFYAGSYNIPTGIFYVPIGGLKSVKLLLEFNAITPRPNSDITVLIDGTTVAGLCGVPNKYVSQMFDIGDLTAGQSIQIRFTNLDTGFSVGTTNFYRMVISARTE
jgi:hypothetical protein